MLSIAAARNLGRYSLFVVVDGVGLLLGVAGFGVPLVCGVAGSLGCFALEGDGGFFFFFGVVV